MDVLVCIIFVAAFIIARIIVNRIQQWYMKFIGADAMFFSVKKKLIAIVIIALLLTGIAMKILGIDPGMYS